MAIRYLIVDDELPGRTNLRLAMAAHPDWQLVAECGGAASARAALEKHEVDLDAPRRAAQAPCCLKQTVADRPPRRSDSPSARVAPWRSAIALMIARPSPLPAASLPATR